jgi:hypothetical protein
MERPTYTPVEPTIHHALPDPKRPQAIALAEIKVGRCDFGWIFACSVFAPASGFAEPLGHWSDYRPRRTFAAQAEALAAAIGFVGARVQHDSKAPIRASVLAWLDGLNPKQLDLFGAAS